MIIGGTILRGLPVPASALPAEWAELPLDQFEQLLAVGALRVIADDGNPIRGNLFASACRELLSHLLHRLGPDQEVQACSWFKQAPDTNGPTRAQRARFAAQGGLPDKLIEDEGYEIHELLSPIVASIGKLNGYVHVRPGKVLNDDQVIGQLRDDILAALGDLIEAIRIWRSLTEDVIRDEIEETAKDALTQEVVAEVDLLATAHRIDHVETTEIEISRVGATTIDLVARGDTYVQLLYGSTSDWRNGDGASMDVTFPFTVTMTAPIADMKNLSVVHKDVDVSSWYGAEERDGEDGNDREDEADEGPSRPLANADGETPF